MSTKRFLLLFATIFFFGSLPFVILQPTGASSAGLSAGFSMPIDNIYHTVLFALIGAAAAFLGRDTPILLPLGVVLMFVIGALMELDRQRYPTLEFFTFGAILLFALTTALIHHRRALLAYAIGASIGFHMGGYYMAYMPPIAAPIYYLLGCLISISLILAAFVALGVAIRGDHLPEKANGGI